MAATNPGLNVPLGQTTISGETAPVYISQEWQIFLQSLRVQQQERLKELEFLGAFSWG